MLNIFEQPWTLLIAAVVVLLVLLILRRTFANKRRWWLWFVPIVLAGGGFGLDSFVQTAGEKITEVIAAVVEATENEDCDAISRAIAADYSDSYHNSKRSLMAYCSAILAGPLIDKNIKSIISMEISESTATVVVTMRVVFDKDSFVAANFKKLMFIKLKLNLQKEDSGQWLINQTEILEVDRHPASWLDIKQASW